MKEIQAELPAAFIDNLSSILQRCRRRKDHNHAKRLHLYMHKHQLDLHPVLGNLLVPMLVECGCLADSQHVFDRLPHKNVLSWTAIISAALDSAQPRRALALYLHMQHKHTMQPDRCLYLALLHACTLLEDVGSMYRLHADIALRGMEGDLQLSSTLIDAYIKCGLLAEAQQIFDRLSNRDAVLWAVLISGYADHGLGKEAGNCFEEMQLEGICPDSVVFVCALKAYGTIRAVDKGQQIHTDVTKRALERELYVGSSLVDMYTKCGHLADASRVLHRLLARNVVSWNALITGYSEYGLVKEAVICFWKMQLEGLSPNSVTFGCILKACMTKEALETGQAMHAEIVNRGLERELHIGSSLVALYSKGGSFSEAVRVFQDLPIKDTISWNGLIAGYTEHGLAKEAIKYFQQMQMERISPNSGTYVCSSKACAVIGSLETGLQIHMDVTKRGLERELYVGNILVDMYTKCNSLEEARQVFDSLPVRDAVTRAALIAGYAEHGLDDEVVSCFQKMKQESVSADPVTYILCLKACAAAGALEIGREIHMEIRKSGFETDLVVGNILIDMYGKCGSVAEAQEVFDKLPVRDTVSWTAMVKAHGENHEADMAIECFEEMQVQGMMPDSITFTCLLAACSHASLLLKAQMYFTLMTEKYKIRPSLDHYSCMVDLYARSGHVYEAEKFIAAMSSPPSGGILTALLSACKLYGEVEVGERCFQHLVELKEEDASTYLLLAEIYASAGRSSDAVRVVANRKPGST